MRAGVCSSLFAFPKEKQAPHPVTHSSKHLRSNWAPTYVSVPPEVLILCQWIFLDDLLFSRHFTKIICLILSHLLSKHHGIFRQSLCILMLHQKSLYQKNRSHVFKLTFLGQLSEWVPGKCGWTEWKVIGKRHTKKPDPQVFALTSLWRAYSNLAGIQLPPFNSISGLIPTLPSFSLKW